jgi:general secretion pathway protein N
MTEQHSHALPKAPPWPWALLGVLVGLAVVLACRAPAAWLAAAVHEASAGRVRFNDARGTLWTGSAQLQVTGGAGSRDAAVLPGRVSWALRPRWLGLHVEVAAGCCTAGALKGRLSWQGRRPALQVDDGASRWPAALLAGLGTPWNTLRLEGELRLATQGLSLAWPQGRLVLAGHAELGAAGMSSRLATLKPLGSYRLTLAGGDASAVELSTLEGRLQLSGRGQWTGSRLRFEGSAGAAPEDEAALAKLLNIIGRRQGARSLITLN